MARGQKFRLKITLPLAVIGLICSAAALVIFVNQLNYASSMKRMADRQMSRVAAETRDELFQFHRLASNLSRQAKGILEGALKQGMDIQEPFFSNDQVNPYFASVMRDNPSLQNLYVGGSQGNFIMLRNEAESLNLRIRKVTADSTVQSTQILLDQYGRKQSASTYEGYLRFDPRERPWYRSVQTGGKASWTDVYRFFSSDKLGITLSVPLYLEGEIVAVLGLDYELSSLSLFLEELVHKDQGTALLIDDSNQLVAHSQHSILEGSEDTKREGVPLASSITDPLTSGVVDLALKKQQGEAQIISSVIKAGGEDLLVEISSITWRDGTEWKLAVVIPEIQFMGDVQKSNQIVLLSSLLGILICMAGGFWISELISRPMDRLRLVTERIREFQLEEDEERVRSVFLEVDRVADSVDRMRTGLRSFAKYVPKHLVRQLIAARVDAKRGGKNKELTILFTDIEGFTHFSENLDSHDVMIFLGDYFTELADIIQETGGTIDKYIGDSILAFWNAPLDVPNHAICSCEAALACRDRIEKFAARFKERGFTAINTRIGIHTGNVTVGNVGSERRMEYTVIGDNVNLANRIESLGKYYGTNIIISQATQKQLDDRFVVRKLDEVVALGKTISVAVYELVGKTGDVDEQTCTFINYYERGLAFYFEHQWQEAEKYFGLALDLKPDDQASRNLQMRCLEGRAASDSPGWIAAYHATSK